MLDGLLKNRAVILIVACVAFWASLYYFVSTAYATKDAWTSKDESFYAVTGGAILETTAGEIRISFFKDKAPETVKNFVTLANKGFYDGTKFHRIQSGFMIQGGDPNTKTDDRSTWGEGGPGYTVPDEISDESFVRGVVVMANNGPGTDGSQFFILTADTADWLDGKYTIFGTVTSGMDVADAISTAPTEADGQTPVDPVPVKKVYLSP